MITAGLEQVARLRRSDQAARLSGVTRKVLSNSKHTLLLPLFGSNRKAFGLPEGHLADFS
ncbi:hypothetical protein [Phocaeicola barnesiae]|uniref:Uncharacterized protein n=1 Tax=Phocaeicola barnesiae TaxID=376804 RepID=A0AAW5N8M2_9BACT|nr:hypothetical protein [Phocaeicola barnesiae]MCR8875246.1 hypothetical protein [Phocaeicola barnesiae]